MPFKNKSQQRAMHAKADRGEMSESVVKEFDDATDFKKLPEKKSKSKSKHGMGKIINAAAREVESRVKK